jgi:AbiJ N-terminal domain 4
VLVTIWRRHHGDLNSDFTSLMKKFWLSYFKKPLDTLPSSNDVFSIIRTIFFDGEWHECYDILEFIACNYTSNEYRDELIKGSNEALEREISAYRFVGNQLTQITSENEISSIEEVLADTQRLTPVYEHLSTALNYLSDRKSPDYRNSIKESISAVESICNLITGGKDSLGEALKKLETSVPIHPALKKGFSAIYGYTSDASGIRHSLLDESNLTFDDAKFMLVSCSGFINYLLAKAATAGITL